MRFAEMVERSLDSRIASMILVYDLFSSMDTARCLRKLQTWKWLNKPATYTTCCRSWLSLCQSLRIEYNAHEDFLKEDKKDDVVGLLPLAYEVYGCISIRNHHIYVILLVYVAGRVQGSISRQDESHVRESQCCLIY